MYEFTATTAISIVLDVPAARLQVIAADRDDVTVEVRPSDASQSRDVKAAERVEVTFDDGILRVVSAKNSSPLLGSSGSVEVTVQAPTGSGVRAATASGEFRGVGRLGDVTFEGASGSVKIDETAKATVTLQSGDISIGRLGDSADITTQKGDLTVTEAVTGTVTLNTQHGDITIGAARNSSATLDARTMYGRIANSLSNAAGAAATLNIHADTAHGDITARSL